MNIVVFDTETTSVNKPFCYNIGYCIVDVEAEKMLAKRDYVVEQVWHNPMLFTTAYFAEKREKYVKAMRSRKTEMSKYGYICRAMIRDFVNYNVIGAYAYNSKFDDGVFTYNDMEELIDVCIPHMVEQGFAEDQARVYMKEMLPKLDYWKRYEELSDNGQFEEFKKSLIDEINALHIEGMPKVEKLNSLVGKFVNLEYRLPNGMNVKFLDDNTTYLGNQLESEFGGERCFGVLANMEFILICTYGEEGADPELVLYKKR